MTKPTPLRAVDSDHDGAEFAAALPHNVGAEQVVLGAVMLDPAALYEARELLDGSEFYRPAHQVIWQAIGALADRGDPFHPIAVGAALGKNLTKAGGAPYLHTLISTVPVAASVGYYAHLIRDLGYARRVIETGTRLVQLGHAAPAEDTIADLRSVVTSAVGAVTAADARGWPEPTPLTSNPDLPGFPLWALPEWLGEYAASVAEVTQTPPDLAGCLALAVVAVAAGGNVWVQAPTWMEPTNLYTVVVLPPGNRKSEVFAAMTGPIREAERRLAADKRPRIAEAELHRRIAEATAEKTAKTATIAEGEQRTKALAEANAAAMAFEAATVPVEPKLFTANATVEKLTSLLAEQGGRFAVLAPEGGKVFSIAGGRYSGAPDLEIMLSGHAGEEMRIDRMGRASERIDAANLTLGVCMQPGVLTRLGETPEFREQGLLGRLLFSVPVSLLGYRNENPDPIADHVKQAYTANLTSLVLTLRDLTDYTVEFTTDTDGKVTDAYDRPERITIGFTPDAGKAVTQLLADTEPRFRPGADLHHMTDWGGKLVGAILRIAGLLHLAEHLRDGWGHPIDIDTLEKAREIGEYFTAHAIAAYDTIGADPAVNDARAIHEWARNTATTRFTNRDLMRGLKHRFTKVTDLEPGLRVLETHGWIRRLPTPPTTGRGRPTAPAYDTHPHTHQDTR